MNTLSSRPLIVASVGGKGGGGTYITPEGEKMIKTFYRIRDELTHFLRNEAEKLESL